MRPVAPPITTDSEPITAADPTEQTLLALTEACGSARTICPTDAARAVAGDDADWQTRLPEVRRVAVRLALEGRLVIYRKGKPVDPSDFKGVYRLGAPRND